MKTIVRIGLVGDRSETVRAHAAIPLALRRAANAIGVDVSETWLSTEGLDVRVDAIDACDGVWCVPGSPYASMNGALAAIRRAREAKIPFLGSCGGFQHGAIEIARDVAAIPSADHQESSPTAAEPLIHRLSCSLREDERVVHLTPGSLLARIFGAETIREGYHCSFGVNPKYLSALEAAGLSFTARDDDGDVRALELAGHPFFVGTLFQSELRALRGETPVLATAFVRAAAQ